MQQSFYIGVDGGATKTIVRVEDQEGKLLGRMTSGPANIRLSIEEAWHSIDTALSAILQENHLTLGNPEHHFHAAMGLAGSESKNALTIFQAQPHQLNTLLVTSDAFIACYGAHQSADGALLVAGTGSVGLQLQAGKITQVGGHGFPFDDAGGGSWIGLQALQLILKLLDARIDTYACSALFAETIINFILTNEPPSSSAKFSYASHDGIPEKLQTYLYQASPAHLASIAPLVIKLAAAQDITAIKILTAAAHELDLLAAALLSKQLNPAAPLPCAMIGGIAPFIKPYLSSTLTSRLVPPQASPDAGAIKWLLQELKCKR